MQPLPVPLGHGRPAVAHGVHLLHDGLAHVLLLVQDELVVHFILVHLRVPGGDDLEEALQPQGQLVASGEAGHELGGLFVGLVVGWWRVGGGGGCGCSGSFL